MAARKGLASVMLPWLVAIPFDGAAGTTTTEEATTTDVVTTPESDPNDPCVGHQCQHGVCIASGSSYSCECADGYTGVFCAIEIDECASNPCQNGAPCTDLVADYSCECPWGFRGKDCEIGDYFTLQQWQGRECDGVPWRCFRLQLGNCTDTLLSDGPLGEEDFWWGKLTFDGQWKYNLDLCWGAANDLEERCTCENHWANVPKTGKNSLGPPSHGVTDSDECHKLSKLTSSRLVNSTGVGDDNLDCGGALARSPALIMVLSLSVLLARRGA